MKIAAGVLFGVFFLLLLGSAFLPHPQWIWSLWGVPVAAVPMLCALFFMALSFFVGPSVRQIAPIVGVFLGLFALVYVESGALADVMSAMEKPPMDNVTQKLLLLGCLGASMTAIWLGAWGLKSLGLFSQTAAVLSMALGVYVAACLPIFLQVPFPAPWQCASIVLVGEIFVLMQIRGNETPETSKNDSKIQKE